jgi:hypothetical protein
MELVIDTYMYSVLSSIIGIVLFPPIFALFLCITGKIYKEKIGYYDAYVAALSLQLAYVAATFIGTILVLKNQVVIGVIAGTMGTALYYLVYFLLIIFYFNIKGKKVFYVAATWFAFNTIFSMIFYSIATITMIIMGIRFVTG